VYVDDITLKSRNKDDHLENLNRVFDIMQAHQLKMNPTKSFLGVASGKFLGFIITSKEFTWIQRKSMPSKRCNLREILRTLEAYRDDWHISRDLYQIFRTVPTLLQVNEEGSLIRLGQCLLRSIRRDLGVSHTLARSYSSSIRKTFPVICSSNGSFLGSFTSSK